MIINKMANNVGSDEVVHLGLYCLHRYLFANSLVFFFLRIQSTLVISKSTGLY